MIKILPRKYYNIAFAFLMALMMSFIMSAFVTFKTVWIVDDFLYIWFSSWFWAFLLWFPIALFVVPFVRKTLEKFVY